VSASNAAVEVVAVGVSTGGPNALTVLLGQLPGDFPVPIVVVQHLPALFTGLLAARLDRTSELTVHEAKDGDVLSPGGVWLAPGGYHMVATRLGAGVTVRLNQDPPENSCRPAADVLFRSVAQAYGAGVLAVVMTGMGQDGFRGCKFVIEQGGHVVVQDEASSVVWGMPGYVAQAGMAERILPLDDIAKEITERAFQKRHPRAASAR
jgi:two-component system chemotaxis response regulator CheB